MGAAVRLALQLDPVLAMSCAEREAFVAELPEDEAEVLLAEIDRYEAANENILDFQARVSPTFHRPDHFRKYAERLRAAVGGGLRLVFSAPPQHGKTEVTKHGLVKMLQDNPGKRFAYITYSQRRARSVSRGVRRILKSAGIAYSGTLDEIRLPPVQLVQDDGTTVELSGGQCIFTSIDGGITGEPVDGCAIIDDPFKNRKEADSENRRMVVLEAYREAIETRVHPGASVIVLATRWHPEDLSGTLISEGWEYINLPAIAEGDSDPNGRAVGEALFPRMWSAEELEKKRKRVGEFSWAALFQGRPRPKGGVVFHEPTYYAQLPEKRYSGAYGIDLAYTAKTSADVSICLELWREDRDGGLDPLFYVVRVDRAQVKAPVFAETLLKRHHDRPGWSMLWRASGTEHGSADFIVEKGVPLAVQTPPGDKLVSSTDVAAAWNDKRVLVPDAKHFPDAEVWLPSFLTVLANFTGLGKERDDDVDALGNAYELLKTDDNSVQFIKRNRH